MHALRLARLAADLSLAALAARTGIPAGRLLAVEDSRVEATPDEERQVLAALAAVESERKAKRKKAARG